jgi:hypothetical protein
MSPVWKDMTDVEVIENVLTCRKAYSRTTARPDDAGVQNNNLVNCQI